MPFGSKLRVKRLSRVGFKPTLPLPSPSGLEAASDIRHRHLPFVREHGKQWNHLEAFVILIAAERGDRHDNSQSRVIDETQVRDEQSAAIRRDDVRR